MTLISPLPAVVPQAQTAGQTPGREHAATVPLTPEQEALATRIAALIAPVKAGPVLTLAEAIAYTKHESDSAFYRWCDKWRVTRCAQGRYARGHLDRALDRESKTRIPSKRAA